ncbi:hypothetical protein HT031_005061 [Scenedesmus sp. PABB004]|nr:hypothetical protein HT031_005061 [Scenedesmus sp. PABB004]
MEELAELQERLAASLGAALEQLGELQRGHAALQRAHASLVAAAAPPGPRRPAATPVTPLASPSWQEKLARAPPPRSAGTGARRQLRASGAGRSPPGGDGSSAAAAPRSSAAGSISLAQRLGQGGCSSSAGSSTGSPRWQGGWPAPPPLAHSAFSPALGAAGGCAAAGGARPRRRAPQRLSWGSSSCSSRPGSAAAAAASSSSDGGGTCWYSLAASGGRLGGAAAGAGSRAGAASSVWDGPAAGGGSPAAAARSGAGGGAPAAAALPGVNVAGTALVPRAAHGWRAARARGAAGAALSSGVAVASVSLLTLPLASAACSVLQDAGRQRRTRAPLPPDRRAPAAAPAAGARGAGTRLACSRALRAAAQRPAMMAVAPRALALLCLAALAAAPAAAQGEPAAAQGTPTVELTCGGRVLKCNQPAQGRAFCGGADGKSCDLACIAGFTRGKNAKGEWATCTQARPLDCAAPAKRAPAPQRPSARAAALARPAPRAALTRAAPRCPAQDAAMYAIPTPGKFSHWVGGLNLLAGFDGKDWTLRYPEAYITGIALVNETWAAAVGGNDYYMFDGKAWYRFKDKNGLHGVATGQENLWLVGADAYVWLIFEVPGTRSNLLHVAALADKSAIAVGTGGTIVRAKGTDPKKWTVDPTPTTQTLHQVATVNGEPAWAVGDGGTILRWNRRQKVWRKFESGTTANLLAVAARGNRLAFAVGEEVRPRPRLAARRRTLPAPVARPRAPPPPTGRAPRPPAQGTILRFDGTKWNAVPKRKEWAQLSLTGALVDPSGQHALV